MGKPQGRGPLGRPRRKWDGFRKVGLRWKGRGSTDWIDLAHDRDKWRSLVNAIISLRVPWDAGNFVSGSGPVGYTGRTNEAKLCPDISR